MSLVSIKKPRSGNQPETTLRKARALAKSLGHDLVRFRKTKTHTQAAYCRHCFKYAFIDGDDVRGGAVSEGCHRKEVKCES